MFRSARTLLLSLILTAAFAGLAHAVCPFGDLDSDCQIGWGDVAVLAEQWLAPPENIADLNADEEVGLGDLAVLAESWTQTGVPLAINEFSASNSSYIRDPQGEYDDWIEIYNSGPEPIDIGGMYLTDDLDTPTMWMIPGNDPVATTIPAHGYLLLWADSDVGDPGLHANFQLNSNGETIGLFDRDGQTLIDSVSFGEQRSNISYGRYPDAGYAWRFFGYPTPRGQNTGAYLGVVADTKFSHDRGFYDQPFSVSITSATEDAIIFYTVDGRAPFDADRGVPSGSTYAGPIPITTTTTIRAVAFKFGWLPTDMDAQTYVFLDDVIRQPANPVGYPTNWGHTGRGDYEMDPDVVNDPRYSGTIKDDLKAVPTLSIAMDRDDLFKSGGQGIYIQGERSERACSAELFFADRPEACQINCAVQIVGGTSTGRWKMDKLSMRLKFKGPYGPSMLRFPLFGDEATDEFKTLVVDARMNNSWAYGGGVGINRPGLGQRDVAQYTRDQFVSDIQNAIGGYAPYGRHVHLYLNGLYWGLYWLHERPDEHFAAAYLGGDADDYDVLKHRSGTVINGSGANYAQMFNVANSSLASSEKYDEIQAYLDVENLIDYLITNYYVGNTDWAHQNWYATRSHVDPTSRWRYHSWDAEHVMEGLYDDRTGRDDNGGPTRLHQRLIQNAEYKMLFSDHVHRHFANGGVLTPEGAAALYQIRLDDVDRAVVGESARWGDNHRSTPYTRDIEWVRERDWLLSEYFPKRSDFILGRFKSRGWYPNVEPPVFHINGSYKHGGHVSPTDLFSMTAKAGNIYYTLDGSDPRLPGGSLNPGALAFEGGSGTGSILVPENATKRAFIPTGSVSDAWKGGAAFDDSAWMHSSGGPGGVGYERGSGYEGFISLDVQSPMYGENATCYVRVPFTVTAAELAGLADLTLKVRYDDGFVAYINGVEVQRAQFAGTPTWDSEADGNHEADGFESFDVSAHLDTLHEGDNILAIHGLNTSTTSSDFLISAELSATKPASPAEHITFDMSTQVKARALQGTEWSALNEATYAIGPIAESLRITEIMYHPQDTNHPDDPNREFIELKNIGAETINLNLVKFTNGVDFTFPVMELAASEYVLVVKDVTAFEARYGAGLNIAGQYAGNLRNGGERVELQDAAGMTIHAFRYRDGWYDITDGLGFSLTVRDAAATEPNQWSDKSTWRPSAGIGGSPGTDDTGLIPELGDVVINEILSHSHAEASDWIELHNTTDHTINIGGWFLSDDPDNLKKYEIAAGRFIRAGGYVVFTEHLHFGNWSDPGAHVPFALSENGETLYLHSGRDGELTGYSEQEKFGASVTGVAFGRYQKSTGAYNFVAMSANTPGTANAYPKVGPIVITEIMYHPDSPADAEYVELLNISDMAVTLYDFVTAEPWRFTDDPDNPGIEFLYPSDPPVTLASGEYILMVKDLAMFSSKFTAPEGTQIFAWGAGRLDNGGEKVQISLPGDVDLEGIRHYIRVDRVRYSDGSHPDDFASGVDPWPTGADGFGSSLSRLFGQRYGNDPNNWQAATPSPGAAN